MTWREWAQGLARLAPLWMGQAAMVVQYDPLLVLLSVFVAAIGSYAGLRTVRQAGRAEGVMRKVFLATSACAIGTSIWSMHFIGMLAIRLPVAINYDVLITLISALVSILMTGIGLSFAIYGEQRRLNTLAGGIFMGLGISCMHYIGMAAIRANCTISYQAELVALSVLVGVLASTLAVWLSARERQGWQVILAALAMGLAISGMHYTAMAAATFLPIDFLAENAQPVMQSFTLAFGVAISTFVVVGFAVLSGLPAAAKGAGAKPATATAGQLAATDAAAAPLESRLPVERDRKKHFLALSEVIAVKAAGHYTSVHAKDGEYFCSLSISDVEALLDPRYFLRVHRSFIVGLESVDAFEMQNAHGTLTLAGPAPMTVPVSRSNLGQLRKVLGRQVEA